MNIKIPQARTLPSITTQRRRVPFDTLVNTLSYNPTANAIEAGGNIIAQVLRRKHELKSKLEQRRQFENLSGIPAGSLGTGEGGLDPQVAYELLKLKQQKTIEDAKLAQKQQFNTIYRQFLDLKTDKSKDSTSQIIQLRKQFVDQKANTFDLQELQALQNSIDNIDDELSQRNILPKSVISPSNPQPKPKSPLSGIKSFRTEAEAETASNAGLIRSGDRIIIGGKTGVWK